jgi:hypothetical protein
MKNYKWYSTSGSVKCYTIHIVTYHVKKEILCGSLFWSFRIFIFILWQTEKSFFFRINYWVNFVSRKQYWRINEASYHLTSLRQGKSYSLQTSPFLVKISVSSCTLSWLQRFLRAKITFCKHHKELIRQKFHLRNKFSRPKCVLFCIIFPVWTIREQNSYLVDRKLSRK